MSQLETISKKTWVLVSTLKENSQGQDLQRIVSQISDLIDEWHTQGKIMWSGGFDDNKTAMTIFDATQDEAKTFFSKYDKACSGILGCYLYQWDAMPLLSLLSK